MNERTAIRGPVSKLEMMQWLPFAARPSDGEEEKPSRGPWTLHIVRGQGGEGREGANPD